jgi:hypothetical protein
MATEIQLCGSAAYRKDAAIALRLVSRLMKRKLKPDLFSKGGSQVQKIANAIDKHEASWET